MVAALDQRGLLNEVCESVPETHTLPESDGENTKEKGLSVPKQEAFFKKTRAPPFFFFSLLLSAFIL